MRKWTFLNNEQYINNNYLCCFPTHLNSNFLQNQEITLFQKYSNEESYISDSVFNLTLITYSQGVPNKTLEYYIEYAKENSPLINDYKNQYKVSEYEAQKAKSILYPIKTGSKRQPAFCSHCIQRQWEYEVSVNTTKCRRLLWLWSGGVSSGNHKPDLHGHSPYLLAHHIRLRINRH